MALSKRLAGQAPGNLLLIGSSGSGKTTLMRAAEWFLEEHSETPVPLVRLHANVLGQAAETGRPGQLILNGLLEAARRQSGDRTIVIKDLLERARRGIVFVDEVDKIRNLIGGQPHLPGVRAQEALLTVAENESIALRCPDWMGGEDVRLDSRDLMFVAAGAFEGLYDAVYDRVTIGADRGALKPVTTIDGGDVAERHPFRLGDWLRSEDLFDYGMSPQFLSRFESVVLLDDLSEQDLGRILLEMDVSPYHRARKYFSSLGYEFMVSPSALAELSQRAARSQRLGARALNEVFRRLLRDLEYDPQSAAVDGAILLDRDDVCRLLDSPAGQNA